LPGAPPPPTPGLVPAGYEYCRGTDAAGHAANKEAASRNLTHTSA